MLLDAVSGTAPPHKLDLAVGPAEQKGAEEHNSEQDFSFGSTCMPEHEAIILVDPAPKRIRNKGILEK